MPISPLCGTWSLIAWFNESADGQRHYPLGPNATGYIHYAHNWHVFVQLAASDRVPYEIADPFGGTEAEDSAAIKSQIAYSGRYEDKGDHVLHHVTHATCPNWVGTVQHREIVWRGDDLRLSAPGALFQGQQVTAYVDWTRVPA